MKNSWWRDLWLSAGQCIRVLVHGREVLLLLTVGCVLLLAMLLCMEDSKEEKSRIAIGIADEDQSVLSTSVCEAMRQMDLYHVTEGSLQELTTMLKQGKLAAVCKIKQGYEAAVLKGRTGNLVTIYETEEGGALLLPDILAGAMMQDICAAKGYVMLSGYQKKTGREKTSDSASYREYVSYMAEENELEFSFDIEYISAGKTAGTAPEQSVLYRQAILAVFSLMTGFLSIYAVLPFRRLCHGTLAKRLETLPVRKSALYGGYGLGALLVPGIFGILFLGSLSLQNPIKITVIPSLLVCTTGYVCVIVCIMLAAARGIKNSMVYQMGMLAMILLFGVLGLVSVVDGVLLPEGSSLWVPNSWYVRKMTELLSK